MDRILTMCVDAAIASLVLLPLFLAIRKRRDLGWVYLAFALYLCGMYAAAGLPDIQRFRFRPRLNVDFFAYMFSDYKSSLLNVLFFMPLGFLLPTIWRRFRNGLRTMAFGFFTSAVIEGAQLFSPRATDVNDLMTNTVGAVAGYGLAMLLQWLFPGMRPENDSKDVYPICGIVGLTMFFVHPLLSAFFLG